MFEKIITRWTEFAHRYPVLACADIVTAIAIVAYVVLG